MAFAVWAIASTASPALLIGCALLAIAAAVAGTMILTGEGRSLARRLGPAGERAVISADEAGIVFPATGLVEWREIELLYELTTSAGTPEAEDAIVLFVRDGERFRERVTTPRTASLVHLIRRPSGATIAMVHTPPGSIFGEGEVLALQNRIAILAQRHAVAVARSDEGDSFERVIERMTAG